MRLTPVMLALLLVFSPGAVAVQASAPTAVAATGQSDTVRLPTDGNTTAVLTLGTEAERTAFDEPSLSLGSALSMERDQFRTRLDAATLDQRLATAQSAEKKKQILNRFRYRIENRIISLKAKQRQLTEAFSNGTVSASEYARTMGQIDMAAANLRNSIATMRKQASRVPKFGLENDARTLKAKLVTLEGPVRNRIAKTLQGRAPPVRTYVATAGSKVVLSSIVDGTYVREVSRPDNRDPSINRQLSLSEGKRTVIDTQYPWAVENRLGTNHWIYGSIQVLRYVYYHPHGNLTAYVDMGTKEVFREIQYKYLSEQHTLPLGPAISNSSENVTVTVNRTYPGGPLRVELTNATGTPLDGRIAVDGEPVGRTYGDGVVWTLGPAEQFRVSATHGNTTVNVTVTPTESTSEPTEG